MNQSTEHWKPIAGYEGLYEVSDQSRVRSVGRTDSVGRRRPAQVKRLRVTGEAQKVMLSRDGRKRIFDVRRLVSDAFGEERAGEWRAVAGTHGLYEVSGDGQVWSKARAGSLGGVVRQSTTESGHKAVGITVNGVQRMHLVHVLVAEAFIGAAPEGKEVCHGNGDPADNRRTNLRYGTRSENVLDQVAHGVHNNASKTHCKNGHEFTPENTMRRSGGGRRCRACNAKSQSEYNARRKFT